ncbi:hypothetical protein Poly30_22490 [Planctomycetes bacterium Poly30]|uniref:Uncharacterized protein n=1 Tax=Saltatorellus ferox TaxID=2528018 RepID=A0A518ERL5_9BACT|nr:hypothetical protein Poly30_22490 [Planctomycetes bacterium Poly30]
MQRIATFTAIAAVLGASVVALTGTFAPDPAVFDAAGGVASETSSGGMDRNSAGILAGAFIGAAVALLSHTLVATALKFSTEAAFKALTLGFFAKCLGAVLPWAAMNYLPQVGRLADSTAYLVAFAIVVVLVLGGGLFDHLKAVSDGSILNDSDRPSGSVEGGADKSPTEIEADSSDPRSGSAFSLPRKPTDGPRGTTTVGSVSSVAQAVSSPVHPPGSSDTLESAT